jgi:arylsulfatase A-like enzyme
MSNLPPRRPNVLWIFADQLRHHALGCNGDDDARTPNIDRLAGGGVVCETAVSQCPVCMPFRGGLVTGQYCHVHGVRVHGDLLTPDRRTVAHAFRAAGYRTSYVGKLHLASTNSNWVTGDEFWVHPSLRAGFEDFYGFDLSNHYYNTHYCTGRSVKGIKIDGHQTDGLTDLTLEHLAGIAEPGGKPWFHVVAYEAPHPGGGNGENRFMPFPAPDEFEKQFDPQKLTLRGNVRDVEEETIRNRTAGYYAMTAHLDHNVGRLLDYLEESGQAENTLVVFFSDHGEMLGSHGRHNKQVPYDESIRIPLIMRLPGTIPAGSRYGGVASGIDIYPTSAGFCGVPAFAEVQGVDLSAAMCGRSGVRRAEALVQWLGESYYGWGDHPYRAIRTDRYTYCVSSRDVDEANGGAFRLLFDNENDPWQRENLFGETSARQLQRDLHATLCRAVVGSGEPIPDFVREASVELGDE